MTPHQLAKSGTEHSEQVAFFAYCRMAYFVGFEKADLWCNTGILPKIDIEDCRLPYLNWIHAVHNQGHGSPARGARAKAEGVRAGIADIFLPMPSGNYHGLYIEMKRRNLKPKRVDSKGGVSKDQYAFSCYCAISNYAWRVCYGWEEAVAALKDYLI